MSRFPLSVLVILLSGMTGCTSQVTLSGWQKNVEQYTANQANGDYNTLRNMRDESQCARFAVIAAKAPANSTDITGVLLGRRQFNGTPWYVFLVGTVKNRDVEEIRVAMLADNSDRPQWLIGREDPLMAATYRRAQQLPWRAANSAAEGAAPQFAGFPNESDSFHLEIIGDTVSVTETHSGARWTLVLEPRRG